MRLGGGDADGVGPAGADGGAGNGTKPLVHADFNGGEVVVPATNDEALAGNVRIAGDEEVDDAIGRERDLFGEGRERGWDADGSYGGARGLEEGIGAQAGAGAVGLPLVTEKAEVGVDVFVLRGTSGPGFGGTVGRPVTVGVLRPETVEDKGWMGGALGSAGMGVAELGRPGEIEQIVVEAGAGAGLDGSSGTLGSGLRGGIGLGFTSSEGESERQGECEESFPHGKRIAAVQREQSWQGRYGGNKLAVTKASGDGHRLGGRPYSESCIVQIGTRF